MTNQNKKINRQTSEIRARRVKQADDIYLHQTEENYTHINKQCSMDPNRTLCTNSKRFWHQ